jgi:broad specificity phosphatase PhoE
MSKTTKSGSKSINNNTNRMFVCRHSERIDEASKIDYQLWLESIDTMTNTTRPINDIKKDPIITSQGILFAQTLGLTLSRITELQDVTCIYCSRLKRCIQTAYEVAKILNLPVYVSTGLSQTAKAIEELDNKNGFQFMPIEEIKETYNEVQWFCCDQSYDQNGVKLSDGVLTDCPQVPWQGWLSPLKYIAQNNKISIVVAHRETIRKLVGEKLTTPYCCMGIFDYDSNPKITTRKNDEFNYIETRTREGQVIR